VALDETRRGGDVIIAMHLGRAHLKTIEDAGLQLLVGYMLNHEIKSAGLRLEHGSK